MEKHKFPNIYQKLKNKTKKTTIHKTNYNEHKGNRIAETAVGSNTGVKVLLQQNYKITPNSFELMDARILFSIIFF